VDDERQVLDSIYDLFRRDYRVFRANCAAEAKNVLRQEQIHIVVSDQRMPDVTGVELLREVKEEFPDTVRVILTAYADLQVVVQAINEGQVFRYVEKGRGPEDLRDAIRQAADYYDLRMERKRLIAELQQANAELRKANALKAAFLDVASHELNTPVTIIKGMTELAAEDVEKPGGECFRGFVNIVQGGAKRLEHLVANMLKLLQAGSFESGIELAPVNVRKLLDAVEAQTSVFLAHRRQTLKITIEPPDAVLNLDRGKMHDVLVNLVMNAIKFSPDGSTIDLSVRAGSGQWAVGSGQDSAEGSSLPTAHCPLTTVIEVSDAGTGIAETDMPHVFEPFFGTFDTLHHSSGSFEYCKRGLGMGLAIVKKFVEMHGGTISVQPRTPRGTSFIIRLPAR
jgi:signal transduction histidine kinase